MIEVEKKFQPTEEQLKRLLADAEFSGEKNIHDLYYDYPDYRLIKKSIRLRLRNGNFELKISHNSDVRVEDSVSEEIENQDEIKKYFGVTSSIEDFVKDNMIEAINFNTRRLKYKIGEFAIDVDELDFGYKCVEIELLVKDESGIADANKKIIYLGAKYGFDLGEVPTKKGEYFRRVKPEVYKQLYE